MRARGEALTLQDVSGQIRDYRICGPKDSLGRALQGRAPILTEPQVYTMLLRGHAPLTLESAQEVALTVIDGIPVTSSVDVARFFEKRHDGVLKRLKTLDCSQEFRGRNFAETFRVVPGPNHSERRETMVNMTRDGFTFLCMGFTGAKAAGDVH